MKVCCANVYLATVTGVSLIAPYIHEKRQNIPLNVPSNWFVAILCKSSPCPHEANQHKEKMKYSILGLKVLVVLHYFYYYSQEDRKEINRQN